MNKKIPIIIYLLLSIIVTNSCEQTSKQEDHTNVQPEEVDLYPDLDEFSKRLSKAALELTKDKVRYDPAYIKIPYPNGDVPADRGVCTDVVIRAYRKLGIDLQKEVHEDMKAHFSLYPNQKRWGLKTTDTNIDHRRVPNLQVFFSRKGTVKDISNNPDDYLPGDLVTWDLGNGLTHIGIVVDRKASDGKTPGIVHNIGAGQVVQNCLFAWKITGHYSYKK